MPTTNGKRTTKTVKKTTRAALKKTEKLTTEMSAFYRALGFFNSSVAGIVHDDPDRAPEFTKLLIKYCVAHDDQCGSGYVYDHGRNVCIRSLSLEGEGES